MCFSSLASVFFIAKKICVHLVWDLRKIRLNKQRFRQMTWSGFWAQGWLLYNSFCWRAVSQTLMFLSWKHHRWWWVDIRLEENTFFKKGLGGDRKHFWCIFNVYKPTNWKMLFYSEMEMEILLMSASYLIFSLCFHRNPRHGSGDNGSLPCWKNPNLTTPGRSVQAAKDLETTKI